MTARILDGATVAAQIRAQVGAEIAERTANGERPPGLGIILVGDDPASLIYVRGKLRDCEEVGIYTQDYVLPESTPETDLLALVDQLNNDPRIDGVLVQDPLPRQIDADNVTDHIHPEKDVDGFHPQNIGKLALRRPGLRSCTPKGVMTLLRHTGIAIRGLDAIVVGASNTVGRPMTLELLIAGCTVTSAHKFTRHLDQHVSRADIVVVAAGVPRLIQGAWIKPGAIVIDVGITREGKRLIGDVEFDSAYERASWITPVPGGVGPMTRAAILQNLCDARWRRFS